MRQNTIEQEAFDLFWLFFYEEPLEQEDTKESLIETAYRNSSLAHTSIDKSLFIELFNLKLEQGLRDNMVEPSEELMREKFDVYKNDIEDLFSNDVLIKSC